MLSYQTDLVYTPIDSNELQVWHIDVSVFAPGAARFSALLSPDERTRAERFVFEKDRNSFAVCRGILRCLLQNYLGEPAKAIRFHYLAKGKPHLEIDPDLQFGVSHSGGIAVIAFTRGCPVGADVEWVRPIEKINDIAIRFFCPEECNDLLSQPNDEQQAAFYRCWTRKEAYIKATGEGLSTPLDQFQVSFLSHQEARIVQISGSTEEALRWNLHDLGLSLPYIGSVAYRGPKKQLRVIELTSNDLFQ